MSGHVLKEENGVVVKRVPIDSVEPHPFNYNQHPPVQIADLKASLKRYKQVKPIVVQKVAGSEEQYTILAGHGITMAAQELLAEKPDKYAHLADWLVAIVPPDWSILDAKGYMASDNETGRKAEIDEMLLAQLLDEQKNAGYDLASLGTDDESLRQMLESLGDGYLGSDGDYEEDNNSESPSTKNASLAERFIVPPFSVLDARQGYWQARKKTWIELGIQSELGRGEHSLGFSEAAESFGYNRGNSKMGGTPAAVGSGGLANQLANRNKNGLLGESEQARSHHKSGKAQSGATAPDGVLVIDQYRGKAKSTESRLSMGWTAHAYDDSGEGGTVSQSGTSIFDPVLCELAYRWFSPPDGVILDPFAGGSVRGVVAAKLGRRYIGIDLRGEQIEANEEQARRICASGSLLEASDVMQDYTPELTPIEQHGGYFVKRDDLFQIAGVRGGKVRTVWALAQGTSGLVTAGSRHSPHVHRVAAIAQRLGIPCRVHVASGENTPDVQGAEDAGAEVIKHKAGYLNVLIARAREDAQETGWAFIPFGVVCDEAVKQIKAQAANLPHDMKRLVMAVGSGVSLSGVLHGMREHGIDVPVLGVCVGKDPTKTLDEYAPKHWRNTVTLVNSPLQFEEHPKVTHLGDLPLDPVYEAKCLSYLQEGDLLWSIGIRASAVRSYGMPVQMPRWIVGDSRELTSLCSDVEPDLIFTCPPYYDLEVYSDHPQDLSAVHSYEEFLTAYRSILKQAIDKLKEHRFVCVVVGDIRDKKGFYRNFVSDTITACQDAGARLYNEAILVTQVGSLPIRAGKQFASSRKLGKTHQNVLVFCKGDPVKAVQACGPVVVAMPDEEEEAMEEEVAHA